MDQKFEWKMDPLEEVLESRGIDFKYDGFDFREDKQSREHTLRLRYLINVDGSEYMVDGVQYSTGEGIGAIYFCKLVDGFEFDSIERLSEIVPYFDAARDVTKKMPDICVGEGWHYIREDNVMPGVRLLSTLSNKSRFEYSITLITITKCPPIKNIGNLVDAISEYEERRKMIDGDA